MALGLVIKSILDTICTEILIFKVAVNIHDAHGGTFDKFELKAGDDAKSVSSVAFSFTMTQHTVLAHHMCQSQNNFQCRCIHHATAIHDIAIH